MRRRRQVPALIGSLVVVVLVVTVEAGSDRGSQAIVRGGSAKWPRLVWSDSFSGPAGSSPNSARWSFDTGGTGWGNQELEYYTSRPANAELDGHGDLVITARKEVYGAGDGRTRLYTSARMQTLNQFQFKYGLVEARIKVPSGNGLIAQFWALGSEAYDSAGAWPGSGEIDTMEVRGSQPNVVEGTIHGPWSWAPNGVGASSQSPVSLALGFHVYGMEWAPDRIRFMRDGLVYQTIAPADLQRGSAWPFRHRFFLLLDLAVGGVWAGTPSADTRFPERMIVDWIRVWR